MTALRDVFMDKFFGALMFTLRVLWTFIAFILVVTHKADPVIAPLKTRFFCSLSVVLLRLAPNLPVPLFFIPVIVSALRMRELASLHDAQSV
jgi:hypothetical protein